MWRSVKYEITIKFYQHDSDLADVFLQMRTQCHRRLPKLRPKERESLSENLQKFDPNKSCANLCCPTRPAFGYLCLCEGRTFIYKSGTPQR